MQGAFSIFLSHLQNVDRHIISACKRDKLDLARLPFKPQDYRLVSNHSTFLDIGSGFGKPNFHVAMQIYPKESIGIEIVPARVSFCIDQKFNFESQYSEQAKREANSYKNASPTAIQKEGGTSKKELEALKELAKDTDKLELKLKQTGLIKGHVQSLHKIKHDINAKVSNMLGSSGSACAESLKKGQPNSRF